MRVAIVHYWFLTSGGGERVVESLVEMFPEADIFALFADPKRLPAFLSGKKLTTSFLDRIPFARRASRALFPLYPLAVESFDLREYDLVISSDSPPIKGLILNQSATHICYCHTPGRYLWDFYTEFRNQLPHVLRPIYSLAAHYVRAWDFAAAQRVDHFVANSDYVAERIWCYYRRESAVIHPPVDTGKGLPPASPNQDYYLSVGRLVENKRLDVLIEACNVLKRRLIIAGTGRAEKRLKAMAGPTIEFLGRVPDKDLPRLYTNCKAFLFAADEDFGIAPLEAQSFGRPVIALGKGGSLETVLPYPSSPQPTGIFFYEQSAESLAKAMSQFEMIEDLFQPLEIQSHASRFDRKVFEHRFRSLVDAALERHSRDNLSTPLPKPTPPKLAVAR